MNLGEFIILERERYRQEEKSMKMRFGLQLKFFLIYLGFGLIIAFGMDLIVQKSYVSMIYEQYYDHAVGIGKLTAEILDGDKVAEYGRTLVEDEEYKEWKEQLNRIKSAMNTYYLYVMYPVAEDEVIYILEAEFTEEQRRKIKGSEGTLGEEVTSWSSFQTAQEVLRSGIPSQSIEVTTTVQVADVETLGSVYVPILDSHQQVVAVIGVDVLMSDVSTYIKNTVQWVWTAIVILCLISFFVMLFLIHFSVIAPIKELERYAEEMENGIFGNLIPVQGRDEISEISRVFNRMNIHIGTHLQEVEVINHAYSTYVPSELFQMLGRTVVTDVKLEDSVNQEMAVMSYAISNFDDIVKRMDAKQIFRFINDTLQQAIPAVVERGGVIGEFVEGGFRVFYTECCEESLCSAIAVCEKIRKIKWINREEEIYEKKDICKEREEICEEEDRKKRVTLKQIKPGFGISYGAVMLGIVGHEKRMAVISVAKYTIMADFLKNICGKYYASILITADAVLKIDGFEENYHSRFLGFIYNSYAKRAEKIYDVFDGDEERVRRLKSQTKKQFEQGVKLFCMRKFAKARTQFVAVLKEDQKDAAAREYLYYCNQYYQREGDRDVDIYLERYE